ncbi:hypothetical protein [Bifidobacterium thermophilum]|uniref:hypothetical protein n=1 Tax=Bifidobacterium thermophilum TaxID=33905 RepID=UPI0030D8EACF
MRIKAVTLQRCLTVQSRCSKQLVFARETALKLMCVEVPAKIDSDEITVVVPRSCDRPRLAGVRAIVWPHELPTVTADGITCVAPDMTWIMCARKIGLREIVLLGDALMRRDAEQKWYSIGQLESGFADFARTAGIGGGSRFRMCAQALKLMRENTDSFPETMLRLTLMQYGLPCPQVNYCLDVPDNAGVRGERLFLDLAYPQARVAVEYDGRQHAWQWDRDQRRLKAIGDAHWAHVAVRSDDLRSEESCAALAASVADRLEHQLGRRIRVRKFLSLPRLAATPGRHDADALV